MVVGNVSGPCMSGFYYVTALPKTNLFLLVIENWRQYKNFYNFNCRITQRYANSCNSVISSRYCKLGNIGTSVPIDSPVPLE